MTRVNLDPLLRPRAIAVVGASLSNPNNVGSRVLHQLRRFAAKPIYQVHPNGPQDGDEFTVADVTALPESVDLLIVALPALAVVPVVEAAARHGVRAALIFSSGFAEGGDEGRSTQDELVRISRETGMVINGPNTIGYVDAHDGVLATFYLPNDVERLPAGPIAIVSQSGALGTYTEDLARDRGIHPGWLVTTGNEADVTVTDVLEYLIERPEVKVAFVTSEGLRDGEAFVRVAARAAELGKPIVMVKSGTSEAGLEAALSHTASISGGDEVFDAVCRQYGVLRASGLEQGLDWVSMLQTGRSLAGDRLALLTGSGGGGVMMADASQENGLTVPRTPEADQEIISKLIPSYGSPLNPVDVTAQAVAAGLDNYQLIVDTLFASEGFDGVVISSGLRAGQELEVAAKVAESFTRSEKPLAVNWYSTNPASRRILTDSGVPTFPDIARAVTAMGALHRFQQFGHQVVQQPEPVIQEARASRAAALLPVEARALTEAEAKPVLASYGLPVLDEQLVRSPEEAAEVVEKQGQFPIVLKLVSADVPHKSDIGGVRLGLKSATEVADAGREILRRAAEAVPDAKIDGLLVQEMAPAGLELVVGLHRDAIFGPVVTVGLGGVLVEIIGEVALRKAPLTMQHARDAIGEISNGRLIAHSRGLSPARVEELAELLVSLGQLALEQPRITEVDINPVIAGENGLAIADALIVVTEA